MNDVLKLCLVQSVLTWHTIAINHYILFITFSCFRRLKTYLRNKTGEERLNGLMLLNLYRDMEGTWEEVIDIMAKVPRRLDIVL